MINYTLVSTKNLILNNNQQFIVLFIVLQYDWTIIILYCIIWFLDLFVPSANAATMLANNNKNIYTKTLPRAIANPLLVQLPFQKTVTTSLPSSDYNCSHSKHTTLSSLHIGMVTASKTALVNGLFPRFPMTLYNNCDSDNAAPPPLILLDLCSVPPLDLLLEPSLMAERSVPPSWVLLSGHWMAWALSTVEFPLLSLKTKMELTSLLSHHHPQIRKRALCHCWSHNCPQHPVWNQWKEWLWGIGCE